MDPTKELSESTCIKVKSPKEIRKALALLLAEGSCGRRYCDDPSLIIMAVTALLSSTCSLYSLEQYRSYMASKLSALSDESPCGQMSFDLQLLVTDILDRSCPIATIMIGLLHCIQLHWHWLGKQDYIYSVLETIVRYCDYDVDAKNYSVFQACVASLADNYK